MWRAPAVEVCGRTQSFYNRFMSFHRFVQIDDLFIFAWSGEEYSRSDPWWQVRGLIDDFTSTRKHMVAASNGKTVDESMSAFRPRTSKTGNLPHLSHVPRKPEPLGTEFKTIADTKTGILLHIEIQEGREAMKEKELSDKLIATAACTNRLATTVRACGQPVSGDVRELIIGDSWFGNIACIEALMERGFEAILCIKTGFSKTPKKEVEAIMSSWPGGTELVLTCKTPAGKNLVFVGYKYCAKKTLFFVMSKNAGSTAPGDPYVAKYTDKYGNVCTRNVPRAHAISTYFKASNKIDVHNQLRQSELALEKKWVTCDGFSRIMVTLMGMTVTDTWLAIQYCLRREHRLAKISINTLAGALGHEILHHCSFARVTSLSLRLAPLPIVGGEETIQSPAESTLTGEQLGRLVDPGIVVSIPHGAPIVPASIRSDHRMRTHSVRPGSTRRYRQECSDRKCRGKSASIEQRPKKGTKYCGSCGRAFCKDKDFNSRCCFYAHLCQEYLTTGHPTREWQKHYREWDTERLCFVAPRQLAVNDEDDEIGTDAFDSDIE